MIDVSVFNDKINNTQSYHKYVVYCKSVIYICYGQSRLSGNVSGHYSTARL